MIVNQARMLAYLLDHMERSASRLAPFYGLHASDVEVDSAATVTVTLRRRTRTGRPRRSAPGTSSAATARAAPSGRRSAASWSATSTNEAWGVMDVLAVTDFPDIRLKSAISADAGQPPDHPARGRLPGPALHRARRDRDKLDASVTPEQLAAVANRILHPYTLEVKDVGWWSVYEIGQRLCDTVRRRAGGRAGTRLPRVFIAGDACHTHSAKAGQGMNVSMADAWNLGWKLAAVLRGTARPELLHTYSAGAPGGRRRS